MKTLVLALSLAVASIGFVPTHADAKRFGGGGSSGMQRSMPSRSPDVSPPSRPAQATPTPAPTPANVPPQTPRRSWMGPLAGLAAGLGIGALLSHFGLGAGMGSLLTMVLLALVAFVVIRFVMRRWAPGGPRLATPNGMSFQAEPPRAAPAMFNATPAAAAAPGAAVAPNLPPGFDVAGFERIAKMIFIRMQAANDTADLNDLRAFTTPEMFSSVRLELQERGNAPQQTDVVSVEPQVRDVVVDGDRQIVSVRFNGSIREALDAPAVPFDEVWHLVRPVDGSREWAIAGIQQAAPALA